MVNPVALQKIWSDLAPYNARLVAVTKGRSVEELQALYAQGQRVFGENRVQELAEKYAQLPKDIEWHFIGHLQTNKVREVVPLVKCIHSVDSWKLLQTIHRACEQQERTLDCLLQVHIAQEESKYGFSESEILTLVEQKAFDSLSHVRLTGLMGMATFTEDENQIRREFQRLATFFHHLRSTYFTDASVFSELSMGMSGDYLTALECGSTMVRVGSALFVT